MIKITYYKKNNKRASNTLVDNETTAQTIKKLILENGGTIKKIEYCINFEETLKTKTTNIFIQNY